MRYVVTKYDGEHARDKDKDDLLSACAYALTASVRCTRVEVYLWADLYEPTNTATNPDPKPIVTYVDGAETE